MRKFSLLSLAIVAFATSHCLGATEIGSAFAGQDLHLNGGNLTRFVTPEGRQVLVLEGAVEVTFGTYTLTADQAVVWLDTEKTEFRGTESTRYKSTVYLKGEVKVSRESKVRTTRLSEAPLAEQDAMVARFDVTGKVFVTSLDSRTADPSDMKIYKDAMAAAGHGRAGLSERSETGGMMEQATSAKKPSLTESLFGAKPQKAEPQAQTFYYPVNISGVGKSVPQIEYAKSADGSSIATVIGRFYIWQKTDDAGGMIELQADSAVIFFSPKAGKDSDLPADIKALGGRTDIEAVYMSGNIVVNEGLRTIRCDEMYYDFVQKKALAINAEMKSFDPSRGVPIYLRAQKVRQVSENRFTAEEVTLTTSEFYMPQLSLTAAKVIVTDSASVEEQAGQISKGGYQAEIQDVHARYYNAPFFAWPKMVVNSEQPDVPLKAVHLSYDNTWGASVETRWYLSRLLGLKQPPGTDNTFMLDYYGKRGVGTGVDIQYKTDEYFGRVLGYIADDHGEDNLGSDSQRRDIKPTKEIRGRLTAQHRQYLEDNWQLTTELGYVSDKNFLESYYRNEFDTGKEQETLVYAKKLKDNWAFSLLAKWRINDFQDQLEELPSAEYHRAGQSLLDGSLTFYSDSEVASFRQKVGDPATIIGPDERFAFGYTRNEVDLPLKAGEWKIVPYTAGTAGYDDRSGFNNAYATGQPGATPGNTGTGMGEVGARITGEYWKVYPDVESRLWDLDGLRHIVQPQFSAATYQQSDDTYDQRDMAQIGLNQILQTRRGPADSKRPVDWMTLNTSLIIVDNPSSFDGAPNRYIWSDPSTPLKTISAPQLFNNDLGPGVATYEQYGPTRTHLEGDYSWRLTDTTALLSDGYYDTENGTVDQYDMGFVHARYPDLSYYLGTRYLRNVQVQDEQGSNSVIWAITYVPDPRYTIIYSQQYDFDYGTNITSEITLLRKYDKVHYGFTFAADQSLDRQSVIFSIWPEGVKELALGSRRYTGVSGLTANQ
jgi:lipopolysaccharide export system protein LptA